MDSDQPYRPPQADVSGPPAGDAIPSGGGITRGIVDNLAKTRPWVTFIGVMTLIGSGLMVLAGIAMTVFGALLGNDEALGPFGGLGLGIVYILLALLYLVPGIYLLKYGGAIKRAGGRADAPAIESALGWQLKFWRFVGILTITMIVLYGLGMILVIIGAAMA